MKKRSLVSGVVAVAMAASVFTTAGAAGVSFAGTNTATGSAVTTATNGAVTATGSAVVPTGTAVTTGTSASGSSTTGTSVKVAQVKGVKAVRKTSKKAVVSWKKVKGAAGYQIKYSLKKNLKSAKTKNVAKKTKLTITGLKKNKVYYVKVRAYKKVKAKKVYGKFSKVVKIKKK